MRLVVNHGTTLTFQLHHSALADQKKTEDMEKPERLSALVVTCRPLSLLLTTAHEVMHLIRVKSMLSLSGSHV